MTALDADSGRTLWEAEHLKGGHFSPKDLFVIDDVVWSGAISSPRSSGLFVGRDLRTGKEKRDIPAQKIPYTFGHHRCHRAKATSRFILASKTGIEFYDIEKRNESVNHWVRGGCLYGIMPANGLIYAPMHSCACHLDSKLAGFNALASTRNASSKFKVQSSKRDRLEKGPAYSEVRGQRSEASNEEWNTYRGNNARSGYAKGSIGTKLKPAWEKDLGERLSAVTIAGGKVFVADIDAHTVNALDAKTGKNLWDFTAGGRVDSPPTIHQGYAYFGSADGYVYCLDADDGELAWRFPVAPRDRQLCAYGQLESVWPVHGSVLIKDGKLFCVGGRSSYLDGGLPFVRLDALTGEVEAESVLDNIDLKTGKDMQLLSSQSIMPSAIPDILSCDDDKIFMRVEKLSQDGERIGSIEFDEEHQYEERHIFSWAGFLEGSWLHRIYMSYGNGKLPKGTYLNWWTYGERNPDGRIIVMDDAIIYSFGLKPKFHTWSSTFQDYQLFSVNKKIETERIEGETIFGKPYGRAPSQKLRYNWTLDVPFYVRSMVKVGDKLFLCGPEDIVDEVDVIERYPAKDVMGKLERQDRILDGREGSYLWVVRAGDGEILEKLNLSGIPAWDSMAAAYGKLYMTLQNGSIVCLKGAE